MFLFIRLELWKMARKRIVHIGFLLLLIFTAAVFASGIAGEWSVKDGVKLQGFEAIRYDREISEEYQGEWGPEYGPQILAAYEKPYYKNEQLWGNYLSRIVYTRFWNEEGGTFLSLEEELFGYYQIDQSKEAFEWVAYRPVHFAYARGWEQFYENIWMLFAGFCLWLSICFAPLFTEESVHGTAEYFLCSKHGRDRWIGGKLGAAVILAAVGWAVILGLYGVLLCTVYGSPPLDTHTLFIGGRGWRVDMRLGTFLALYAAISMAAVLAHTFAASFISACMRKNLTSSVLSVVVYVLPVVLFVILPNVSSRLLMILYQVIYYTPVYLGSSEILIEAVFSKTLVRLGANLTAALLLLLLSVRKYRRFQIN